MENAGKLAEVRQLVCDYSGILLEALKQGCLPTSLEAW